MQYRRQYIKALHSLKWQTTNIMPSFQLHKLMLTTRIFSLSCSLSLLLLLLLLLLLPPPLSHIAYTPVQYGGSGALWCAGLVSRASCPDPEGCAWGRAALKRGHSGLPAPGGNRKRERKLEKGRERKKERKKEREKGKERKMDIYSERERAGETKRHKETQG